MLHGDFVYEVRIDGYDDTDKSLDLKEFVHNQLKDRSQENADFVREGKVKIFIANPVLKKQFINALALMGGVPDYSFNKDIVSISVFDVMKILEIPDKEANAAIMQNSKPYLETHR